MKRADQFQLNSDMVHCVENVTIDSMLNRTRMSHVDAAWLHAENPRNLVVIHALLQFAEPVVLENLYAVLQTRLVDPFPRFRRRVEWNTRSGKAWWVDMPDFDVREHVVQEMLTEPIEAYVGRMMSVPIDFTRSPWQLRVLTLPDGSSSIFVRVHHVMGDGIALVRTLFSMTDGGEYIQVLKQPDAGKSRRKMLMMGLRGIGTLLGLVFKLPDTANIYKGQINLPKKAAWSRPIAMSDVSVLRQKTGGTVNDVLLTALGGALRDYQIARTGTATEFRATIPVNLRPLDGPIKLGNKFGLLFLTLPLEIADRTERMAELKRRMDILKRSAEPIITYGLLNFFGYNPPPIIRLYFRLFSMKATAVMTNVPGPTNQVTFAGTPMDAFMFWVPQPAGLGLGISILSYNGEVRIGIATDAALVPDPQTIIDTLHVEINEMLDDAR